MWLKLEFLDKIFISEKADGSNAQPRIIHKWTESNLYKKEEALTNHVLKKQVFRKAEKKS